MDRIILGRPSGIFQHTFKRPTSDKTHLRGLLWMGIEHIFSKTQKVLLSPNLTLEIRFSKVRKSLRGLLWIKYLQVGSQEKETSYWSSRNGVVDIQKGTSGTHLLKTSATSSIFRGLSFFVFYLKKSSKNSIIYSKAVEDILCIMDP